MNLVTGQIEAIYEYEGMKLAKVNVCGAQLRISLALLRDAKVSDTVLCESGVAISKFETEHRQKE